MARQGSAGNPLTVGDLFCGAGGFSEGFEQAGFRIAWGVDNWPPALRTFKANHPKARTILHDIMSLSPGSLEPVDVLIGSPPCIHFSAANRGGNGDRASGMRLVRRFLTFVRELGPRYWVMENVPGLLGDLDSEMTGDNIRLNSGKLSIPVRKVLNAADYGTPQTRKRLYSGSFPIPTPDHGPLACTTAPLRKVLEMLPDPTRTSTISSGSVRDPVYPRISIPVHELMDHIEDSRWALTKDELRTARRQKLFNAVYGKMTFPDDIDRPSRTITATRTRGSRSTIVVPFGPKREPRYRTLTLRESASVQGFPLTYQFWAPSMSVKDALVGNAVPPPVARRIAEAILIQEGRRILHPPLVDPVRALPPRLSPARNTTIRLPATRRYRGIVPIDWKHEHRVELDNQFPPTGGTVRESPGHSISWKARLYLGYATRYRCYEMDFPSALQLGRVLVSDPTLGIRESALRTALLPVVQRCLNGFPDGITLQSRWALREPSPLGPDEVVRFVATSVSRAFPASKWHGVFVSRSLTQPILSSRGIAAGTEAGDGQPTQMSVRLTVGLVALSIVCERLNRGVTPLEILIHELTNASSTRFPKAGDFITNRTRLDARAPTRTGPSAPVRLGESRKLNSYQVAPTLAPPFRVDAIARTTRFHE